MKIKQEREMESAEEAILNRVGRDDFTGDVIFDR